MKKLLLGVLALTTIWLTSGMALAKPGLLLVAHGSPQPEWNKPVLDFGKRVAEAAKRGGEFSAVRVGLLESAQPDIPTALAELESAGCDRVIAVPLFVADSGHTHFDVPAALGVYASPRTARIMAAEGATPARPKVPITMTNTLAEGDLLRRFALDEVKKLSRSPKEEAIVVLAHGDPEHNLLVDRLMRDITSYCCGEAAINDADWAYIGVGQEFLSQGMGAILAAAERKKRVIVVGIYVSTSAAKIQKRVTKPGHHGQPATGALAHRDVVFAEGAIVDHPQFLNWVLDSARAALAPAKETAMTTSTH